MPQVYKLRPQSVISCFLFHRSLRQQSTLGKKLSIDSISESPSEARRRQRLADQSSVDSTTETTRQASSNGSARSGREGAVTSAVPYHSRFEAADHLTSPAAVEGSDDGSEESEGSDEAEDEEDEEESESDAEPATTTKETAKRAAQPATPQPRAPAAGSSPLESSSPLGQNAASAGGDAIAELLNRSAQVRRDSVEFRARRSSNDSSVNVSSMSSVINPGPASRRRVQAHSFDKEHDSQNHTAIPHSVTPSSPATYYANRNLSSQRTAALEEEMLILDDQNALQQDPSAALTSRFLSRSRTSSAIAPTSSQTTNHRYSTNASPQNCSSKAQNAQHANQHRTSDFTKPAPVLNGGAPNPGGLASRSGPAPASSALRSSMVAKSKSSHSFGGSSFGP